MEDPSYKILFIGETGSGKTSLLNLIGNYGLVVELGYEAGVERFHSFNNIKFELNNERMASKTNSATMYSINIGGNWPIGVIDTPGFGDSRGIDQDKENVGKIIETLKTVEYINCVCLVINGRAARMSGSLKYVLAEVTSILPKTVLNNVIVVFTNTSNLLFLTFDTRELTKYFGCEIKNTYCIENPYCLYEKAKECQNETGLSTQKIAEGLKEEFQKTAGVFDKMFAAIKPLEQVHTNDFQKLYDKKQEVEKTVLTTLVEYNNQTKLAKAIAIEEEKIKAAVRSKSLYEGYEAVNECYVTLSTDHHNTLCGHPECYSNCHIHCNLPKSMDKNAFKSCWCMRGGDKTICVQSTDKPKGGCGHSYRYHYHNEVRFEKRIEKVVDPEMKKKFEEAKTVEARAQVAKREFERKKQESEDKKKQLSKHLVTAIEEFEELGINRSYLLLLENQLFVIEQYLAAEEGQKDHLNNTKEELVRKILVLLANQLSIVEEQLKKGNRNYDLMQNKKDLEKRLDETKAKLTSEFVI